MGVFDTVRKQVVNLVGITSKGQATKAESLPVTLASDQGSLAVLLQAGSNFAGYVGIVGGLPAGSQKIGMVDIFTIYAGENHIGSVGGETVVKSASVTRPANTTAYAAGDVIADSTTAPADLTIEAGRVNGGGGIITDVILIDSANQSTDPQVELWLFTVNPTRANDNAALALADGDLVNLVGVVTVGDFGTGLVSNAGSGAAGSLVFHARGLNMGFRCATAEKTLHWLLVVRNAYTPVSGESFTLILKTVE